MTLVRSAFVMHWIVGDKNGPMTSNRPPGAGALESALRQCPGNLSGSVGHPGKRFRVACRAVGRLTKEHRGTTERRSVNCPACFALVQKVESLAASQGTKDTA